MVDAEMDGGLELEFFRQGKVGDAELFRSERVGFQGFRDPEEQVVDCLGYLQSELGVSFGWFTQNVFVRIAFDVSQILVKVSFWLPDLFLLIQTF